MELLHEVAVSPGRAVVVVTHDNRIFEFAHSITYMEDGRIVRRSNGNGNSNGSAGSPIASPTRH
jgi:putative ABC transport system ATP-binding protein